MHVYILILPIGSHSDSFLKAQSRYIVIVHIVLGLKISLIINVLTLSQWVPLEQTGRLWSLKSAKRVAMHSRQSGCFLLRS